MRLPDQPAPVLDPTTIDAPAWQRSPLNIAIVIVLGSAVPIIGVWLGLVLTLPIVAIASCYWLLAHKADVPVLHAIAGAFVFGETIWALVPALLSPVPYTLLLLSLDLMPALLMASVLAGRFSQGRGVALPLWLLAIWKGHTLYSAIAFAAIQPSLAIFVGITIRGVALIALTLLALGVEDPTPRTRFFGAS